MSNERATANTGSDRHTYAKTVLDSVGITSFEADVNISNLYGVLPRRLLVVDQEFDAALEALISNGVDADFSNGE